MDIVSRAGWGATAPRGGPMPLPAREVWLHHSVTSVTGDPRADMRTIERVGIERFGRFSYSWAVHPTGTVLEGAGVTIGAHTAGRNSTSFGIVLIGNYEQLSVTDPQMASVAGLIRWLVATGKLQPGTYPTGGHRDLKSTACPGARAYSRIGELRQLVANPTEEDVMASLDDVRRVVREELTKLVDDIAAASGQKAHEEINEGFSQSGSTIRVEALELARRGVNEALGAGLGDGSRGLLKARLDGIEATLAEIGAAVAPSVPPVEAPDVPPPA